MNSNSLRAGVCVVALSFALVGCSTNDDPAKGGFFSGVKNLTDGTYSQRVDERKKTLEDAQDQNTQQQRSLDRTNSERDAVAAQRTASETKLATMNKDLAAIRKKLASANSANAKAKRDVADLQQQVSDLQAKVDTVKQDSFTPDAEKKARLDALQKEKEALESQVDMALHR